MYVFKCTFSDNSKLICNNVFKQVTLVIIQMKISVIKSMMQLCQYHSKFWKWRHVLFSIFHILFS